MKAIADVDAEHVALFGESGYIPSDFAYIVALAAFVDCCSIYFPGAVRNKSNVISLGDGIYL